MKIAALVVISFAGVLLCAVSAGQSMDKQMSDAIFNMRIIDLAEVTYASTYGDRGFACDLTTLADGPDEGEANADHAALIDWSLGSGKRKGYVFKVNCTGTGKPYTGFVSQAEPETGEGRAFCSDETGVIRYAEDGKASTCFKTGKRLN